MKKIIVVFVTLTQLAPLTCCPTCIGLPRLHERPFFERKSFVAALQEPKAQKLQSSPQKAAPSKQSSGKM